MVADVDSLKRGSAAIAVNFLQMLRVMLTLRIANSAHEKAGGRHDGS